MGWDGGDLVANKVNRVDAGDGSWDVDQRGEVGDKVVVLV